MGKQRRRVARAHFKALAEAAAKAAAEKSVEDRVVEKPKPITKKSEQPRAVAMPKKAKVSTTKPTTKSTTKSRNTKKSAEKSRGRFRKKEEE